MVGERAVVVEKEHKPLCCAWRFSWSAVFVGTLVAIGISFLFQLLGLGLGLAAFRNQAGATALAIEGFIGILIATIVTMFIAGMVAGRLGSVHSTCRGLGALYGFTTWCLSLVVMVIFMSHVNLFIASSYNAMLNKNPELASSASGIPSMSSSAGQTSATSKGAVSQESTAAKGASMGNTENITTALSVSFFILFIVFIIGAISSILGGIAGHRPMKSNWEK